MQVFGMHGDIPPLHHYFACWSTCLHNCVRNKEACRPHINIMQCMCMKACKSSWSPTTPKYSASCSDCLYTTWWLCTVNCESEYCSAVSLILLCWVLTILEPYGLRLKHVVMSYYYPERARQRAVWLYNNILRSRGGFLKFIRRQLRRKFGKSKDGVIEKVSLMDRLRAKWVQFFGFRITTVSYLESY